MDPFNSGEKSTSSEQNEPLEKPKMKRKRSNSTNCHQCHKNDKGRVVRCNQCSKQYCAPCITRWYPTIAEPSFAEACPICRNICNCGACLQSKRELMIPEIELSTEDKVYYLKYKIGVLLPSLKNFFIEEKMETEEKANIQDPVDVPLFLIFIIKYMDFHWEIDQWIHWCGFSWNSTKKKGWISRLFLQFQMPNESMVLHYCLVETWASFEPLNAKSLNCHLNFQFVT